jgi:archaellum biogenesis protein FlaJ (TadC family)
MLRNALGLLVGAAAAAVLWAAVVLGAVRVLDDYVSRFDAPGCGVGPR